VLEVTTQGATQRGAISSCEARANQQLIRSGAVIRGRHVDVLLFSVSRASWARARRESNGSLQQRLTPSVIASLNIWAV
jgi:hypothetical protein